MPDANLKHLRAAPLSRGHRFRFTLKQLLLAIAVLSLLLGIWAGFIRRVVYVRPARADDRLRDYYFGMDDENTEVHNVAVVRGSFTLRTWLHATLFAVEGGKVRENNGITIGRSPNFIIASPWQTLTLTLALGSRQTPNGRVVQLGSVGQFRGGGSGGGPPVTFTSTFSDTFTGSMTPGREYILYAEGDTKFDMNRNMSLAEFSQKNPGNYLVVMGRLE